MKDECMATQADVQALHQMIRDLQSTVITLAIATGVAVLCLIVSLNVLWAVAT